jgi:hypothetical protein
MRVLLVGVLVPSAISLMAKDLLDCFLEITEPWDLSGAQIRWLTGEEQQPNDLEPGAPVLTVWFSQPIAEQEGSTVTRMTVDGMVGLYFFTNDSEVGNASYDAFSDRHDAAAACRLAVARHAYKLQTGAITTPAYIEPGSVQQTVGGLAQSDQATNTIATRFRFSFEEFYNQNYTLPEEG